MSKIVYFDYEFLAGEFAHFWHTKKTAYWRQTSKYLSPESSEGLVLASSRHGISKEEFIERFVQPFEGLSRIELTQALMILSSFSVKCFGEPLEFNASVPRGESQSALHWLLVQVLDLDLPGVNKVIQENSLIPIDCALFWGKGPVHQCLNCGRIDAQIRKYCHKPDCPKTISKNYDGPDPSSHGKHVEGCCFREFGQAKKTLKNALKLVAANNSLQAQEKRREITRLFLEFCQHRYERNKLIAEAINTAPVK
jgi:hypothetical protein